MAGRMRHQITTALTGATLTATALLATAPPASAATTASFTNGVLSVSGDSLDNTITISRDRAGRLLVNGGAVSVVGGAPTVANTQQIQVFGLSGNDRLTLDEASGTLPGANLIAGLGDDVVTGGSGADRLFGQAGADTLLGRGGNDLLFGGSEADTLTGGDADDQVFGEAGDDRLVWTPGDDTDVDEGGPGTDTVEVNGGGGAETFRTTANGARVRFERVTPAPFALDIGTGENLIVNANGGDDRFDAVGNLAALIRITVDAGPGADVINGGDGADLVLGGDGDDVVDGQQGSDVALLGAGADTFGWDPGDGNDVVEGQGDADRLVVDGSAVDERISVLANGGRVLLTRDVANVVIDVDDVEALAVNASGGADTVTVNDLSGTDTTEVVAELGRSGDLAPDLAVDTVRVHGTAGADNVQVTGDVVEQQIVGLRARVTVRHLDALFWERVTLLAGPGDDVVVASLLSAPAAVLLDGEDGDDVLIGGNGDDLLSGAAGDDVLVGGPGTDTLDGGPGSNVLLGGEVVTNGQIPNKAWLATHARVADGGTQLDLGGRRPVTIPGVSVEALQREATA